MEVGRGPTYCAFEAANRPARLPPWLRINVDRGEGVGTAGATFGGDARSSSRRVSCRASSRSGARFEKAAGRTQARSPLGALDQGRYRASNSSYAADGPGYDDAEAPPAARPAPSARRAAGHRPGGRPPLPARAPAQIALLLSLLLGSPPCLRAGLTPRQVADNPREKPGRTRPERGPRPVL